MPRIKDLRSVSDTYREALRRKNAPAMLEVLDGGLGLYDEWRGLATRRDGLLAEINSVSKEFGRTKDSALRDRSTALKAEAEGVKAEAEAKESQLRELELRLPNFLAEGVPDGEGEGDEVAIEYRGTPGVSPESEADFARLYPGASARPHPSKPFHHYELVGPLIDQDKAGEVAQSRFYYEFDELVALDFALSMHAMEFFRGRGYGQRMMVTPYALRKSMEQQICYFQAFEDTIFEVAGDELVLLPSSEHSIVAYYFGQIFEPDTLPLRVLAWSPCFRKEAGAHGKDTRGIFRVKQFHKVEIHSILPEGEDLAEVERIRVDVHDFLDTLGIPSRSIVVPAGDMDKRALKQVDVECWMPGQGRYRETHSIATLGTWVSEKAGMRYRLGAGKDKKLNLTANVYATGVAVQRMICALCENHYDHEAGAVVIPESLRKYTMGIETIPVERTPV